MMTAALKKIESILARLNVPLKEDDFVSGWTIESQKAAKEYFEKLRSALISSHPLPPLGIVRGLDHRGVTGGDLLEAIAHVTNVLRKTTNKGVSGIKCQE